MNLLFKWDVFVSYKYYATFICSCYSFLSALDKSTLRLLSDNLRVCVLHIHPCSEGLKCLHPSVGRRYAHVYTISIFNVHASNKIAPYTNR